MHPMMIEALAAEHRTELLRQAEAYRRFRTARRSGVRLPLASIASLAERATASLHRSAPLAVQPQPQSCCA